MTKEKIEEADAPVSPDTRNYRKVFWVFLGVVLASRLMIWSVIQEHPQSFLEIDSSSYTDPAEALIAGGR